MWHRRYPSIFDIFEGFPWRTPIDKKGREEDWFRSPFEDLIKGFDETMAKEFRDLVSEDNTPEGKVRRYGPFVYGFSYVAEPGKEPVFREFGNIKPTLRGMEPSPAGREPLVDVMEEADVYKIFAELPGVDKSQVKLDVAEDSVEIKTDDQRKFYKMVYLDSPVDPDSTKATYNNGVLTLAIKKMQKRKGKEIKID